MYRIQGRTPAMRYGLRTLLILVTAICVGLSLWLGYHLHGIKQRHAAFAAFFDDCDARLADAQRLRRQAWQALAECAFWAASQAFDQRNVAACHELLEYARLLDPELASRRIWTRFRWKQRMGPKVWSLFRPLADRFRGVPA